MGTVPFRSRPRHAFARAKQLRAGYVRDLLLRPWRVLKAWQRRRAPADGAPAAAAPASDVVLMFAPVSSSSPDRCTTREQSNTPLADRTRRDRVCAESMRQTPIPSVSG